ncbi:MAG: glycosyltransferase family 2 protein, partial [Pontimonas sp.]
MTTLGLVVVGYQSDTAWPGFFESLADSTVIPDHIVVVENSPSLPTSIPTLPGLSITVLHRPDNPGYGASANHGVAELAEVPDLIIICNPDIVWQALTLEELTTEMESRPTVGIAGPRLLNSDG